MNAKIIIYVQVDIDKSAPKCIYIFALLTMSFHYIKQYQTK